MMANCSGRSLAAARFKSAGTSFRWVKSPLAPKMTITHGSAFRAGGSAGLLAGKTLLMAVTRDADRGASVNCHRPLGRSGAASAPINGDDLAQEFHRAQ